MVYGSSRRGDTMNLDYPFAPSVETHEEAQTGLIDDLAYWMEAGFTVIDDNAVEVLGGE